MRITQIPGVQVVFRTTVFIAGVGLAGWAGLERAGMDNMVPSSPESRLSDCLFAKLMLYKPPLTASDNDEIMLLVREAAEAEYTRYTHRVYGLLALQALGASVSAMILARFLLALVRSPDRLRLASEPKLVTGRA